MDAKAIYTIGYGQRRLDAFVALLKQHNIDFLIDVRSAPYSKFKPEFSRDKLAASLQRDGLRYVFMVDLLGGRPDDETCYVKGKVDYERVKLSEPFRRGIGRLRSAWQQRLHVCIMCSEGRPQDCHRSKLIGEVLAAQGIPVRHIDADGALLSQQQIMQIITGPQKSLFPETFRSRKKYRDE